MSENVKKVKVENEEKKSFFSEKNLAVVITAGVLVVIFIAAGIFGLVDAISRDVWFDYMNSNLDSYLEFTKDYKDFEINVDIAKSHEIDVEVTKLNMVFDDRKINEKYGNNPITSAYTISAGDDVALWYNGYLINPNTNEKIYVDGMCNFSSTKPHTLSIGGNGFVPGFELNLVGVNTGDYDKLVKVTQGAVTEDLVVYVDYSVTNKDDSTKKDKFTNVRMDLSEDLDAKYGAGFKAALLALTVGTKSEVKATLNEKEITYSDLTVTFGVSRNLKPIIVEVYFPYDYSKTDLRNETAYFEVYVESIVDYICPEFTDEYLTQKMEDKDITLTPEELDKYEGATLVEKYENFTKKTLEDIYVASYESLVESAVWNYYSTIVKMKKYPGKMVDETFDSYVDELTSIYISNGGRAYDSTTGSYKTYDTLDAYIPAYLGLSSSQNWKNYVKDMAKDAVQERMTMYYILKAEGLVPSEKRFNEVLSEIKQEYIDEYIVQYMDYEGKTKDDYTEEEYEQLVADCTEDILSFYDDEYFETRVYYTIVAETMIDWPTVKTLDDRHAYPYDSNK